MKQLLQNVKSGESIVTEVPVPAMGRGHALVQISASLVSAGTERMVVDFAEKNMLEKARARPDLVRQTVGKAQREGLLTTIDAVRNRLDQPLALGTSCAGTIVKVGSELKGFKIGDRVACAGAGYASHAEVVTVPQNLLMKLPHNVEFEDAAFTTLAAIALQGIRLADLRLGETVAVIGLGLLGQLTVQMLKASGCVVIGMDIQFQRAELALQIGANAVTTDAKQLEQLCLENTSGQGADAVLITADTKSNQPVETAGEIARKKGTVVAVGAVGMDIPRRIYYDKELAFHISSSYGPGRYDPAYEEGGQDYPYAYVRWTENRNMQAFIQMLSAKQVDVKPLISHRFPIDDAPEAHELITGKRDEAFLGVLLTFPDAPDLSQTLVLKPDSTDINLPNTTASAGQLSEVRLGVLGAGNFANATLLPAIKNIKQLVKVGIASSGGVSARTSADRFDFGYCTSNIDQILQDDAINTVAILTRHNLHAKQVLAALRAGKNVFVEKPLCLTEDELQMIVDFYTVHDNGALNFSANGVESTRNGYKSDSRRNEFQLPYLMVGFNRRFAPYVEELKTHLQKIDEPLVLHYRANAGFIPADHWTQNPKVGGGRLLGEGCHFIDLLLYLTGKPVQRVTTRILPNAGRYSDDNFVTTLEFVDGSLGTVTYVANGDKGFSKEMLEVFGGGLSARIDDYRTMQIRHNSVRVNRTARLRQDKGHAAEWKALTSYLTGTGVRPMTLDDIVNSMRVTFAAHKSMADDGIPISLAI